MSSAAGTVCMFCLVLFSLLVTVHAEPCDRLYMQGLDSTTTFYPQLAGVYKLQKAILSQLVSVSDMCICWSFLMT